MDKSTPAITTGIPKIPSQKIFQSLTQSAFFEKLANEKKEQFIRELNPESLRKLIAEIRTNNTDSNKREISSEEAKGFVGDNIAAIRKAVKGNEKLQTELREAASPCAYLGSSLYAEHAGNKLTHIAQSMISNVELLQTMAHTINNCGGELGGDYSKEIEAARAKLAKQWKEPHLSKPNLGVETKEIIDSKFDNASAEVIAKITSVFHENPDIVTAFMNMPKVRQLQTIKPDEVCQHLPPNNPPPKGQSKIALRQ